VVDANAYGEVRGYLKNVPIPLEGPVDSFNLAPFFGAGFLSVTRYLDGARRPFVSNVMMAHGSVAKDLAHYYLQSEQIHTAFNLSVKFDRKGVVTGAGGLFLQAMPQADDKTAAVLEERVWRLPSIGEAFSAGTDPETLIRNAFQGLVPKFLGSKRVEFMCHCNHGRTRNLLTMLPMDDLRDLRDNGPFPVELRCHHCNTRYAFDKGEVEQIYGRRFPNN
jgi:molecular chaperone Hsp33